MKDKYLSTCLPIDNLANWPKHLRGCKMGAVLHPASVGKNFRHSLSLLEEQNGKLYHLSALFGPQHGILGQTQDNMIEWEGYTHPRLKIPVYSLYGEHREPSAQMLKGLDVLLIDLQDVGARYYTFIWTLYLCMKACEKNGITIVVCDRPNPINAVDVEGPLLDPEYKSFVGLHPIPVRHGKTIGQLAEQFKSEAFPNCPLEVLPMENWNPKMWYDETGLPWVMPSPNLPTLETAVVYPGMCLLEATNISEARGTTKPFELFGAPFIDAPALVDYLTGLKLPGAVFREAYFQPTFHKFAGELCAGAQIHVVDRNSYLPYKTTMEILKYLLRLYPDDFKWKAPPYEYEYQKLPIEILLGGPLHSYFPGTHAK